jgi:signal transduction histidine kinase
LLPTLRLYIVVSAISPVVTLRLMDRLLGMHGSFLEIIRADVLFFVVLMAYTSWPWLRREMGGAFLPVALIVKTAQALVGTYLASSPFVPGNMWENFVPIAMLRLAVHCQMIVIFTAWQYELVWPITVGAALTAINAAAAFPYVKAGGPLYPLYVAIVTIEFMMASGSGLAIGLLMRNQRRQAAELDKRNRKLAEYASMTEQLAVTQERNRLARELHDTLAHSLSAVAVQIEAAQALSEIDAAAEHKMLEQALQTTRSGLTDARRSLHALRASPLQDLGLSLAVRHLAESAAARAGLKLDLHIGSHLGNLTPAIEQCLYRVAQEALTNVARHANAASVQVNLARENGHVRLTVRDDGRGFDTAAVADTRYGLKGLRERAETVGGALVVESEKDKGTKVALTV